MSPPSPLSPLPPRAFDPLVGWLAFGLWRGLGLLVLPLALLHPRLRHHVWRVPVPVPGWTWIHGASAGEHRAARALAPLLPRGAWPTRSTVRTPVPGAFPAPLDLPFVVEHWLDRARPGRLVLIEGELWPGWLVACRRRGIPVVVVNARESRGARRWRRSGPLGRWLLQGVQWIAQEEVGDLKTAAPPAPAGARSLPPGCIIGCSTRQGDEAALLAAWQTIAPPRPLLVLAPRQVDRAPELAALVASQGLRVDRWSSLAPPRDVLIIDTMGELSSLLPGAAVAFIGGTFDETLGGHSPAEAHQAGVPVVHGPHTHANPAAFAAAQGHTAQHPSALPTTLRAALERGPAPAPTRSLRAALETRRRLPPARVPAATAARPLLRPLVPVVRAVAARGRGWRGRPQQVGVPVISVGGLTAGGAGKTPVAGWLAARLPGAWVVARGHRRARQGPPIRVGRPGQPPPHGLGDELEMLRRRGIPVVSGPDRLRAARVAIENGAQIIILDDGFQHRRLDRDLDLCCLDGRWPGGRGPLPVGTRREPWSALHRADVIWLHNPVLRPQHLESRLPDRLRVRSTAVPHHWQLGGARLPLAAVQGSVTVAAGLARPEGLVCAVMRLGLTVERAVLVGDHRPIPAPRPGWVLSEKDGARLPLGSPQRLLVMDLQVELPTGFHQLLHARTGRALEAPCWPC